METILHFNASLAGFVVVSSLKASVLIALVLLAQTLLGRWLSAQGRYWLWLAVVVSLVTPVGFTATMPQLQAWAIGQTKPTQVVSTGDAQLVAQSPITNNVGERVMPLPAGMDAAPAQQQGGGGWSLADALPLLWLSGALLFMGVVLVRHFRFAAVVRAAVPPGSVFQDLLDDCRHSAGCRQQVRLLCAAVIESPLITGWLRPCLLLPVDAAQQLNEMQLRHVFMHELMHVRHNDIATNWLLALLQAMHWFNPLMWLGFNRLRLDRESARDVATLECLATEDRHQYGQTLLQLSQPQTRRIATAGALGIVDDHAQLKRRLVMIVQNSLPMRFQSLTTGVLLLLFGTLAFSKPTIKSDNPVIETSATIITQVPAIAAPIPAVNNSTVDAVVDVIEAAPARSAVTNKRAVVAKKTATATPVAAREAAKETAIETAASAHTEFAAPTAEHVLTLALADIAMPAVEPEIAATQSVAVSSVVTTEAKPETYADWKEIQALASAATQARDPGVRSITEWNRQAQECGVPVKRFGRLDLNLGKDECRKIRDAIRDVGQISKFWSQCENFGSTYNRLARNFARADRSQFVDQALVRNELTSSYRTLSEFCSTVTYQQKYPTMVTLITYANFSLDYWYSSLEVNSLERNLIASTPDYHLAWNGMSPPN